MANHRAATGQNMRTYKVNKAKLLETLKANLEKHRSDVDKAWVDYKELVKLDIQKKKKDIAKALNDLETRFEKDPKTQLVVSNLLYFDLTPPVSYVKEYEEVIDGLTWEISEEIELTSVEFAQYVRDDWDWKPSVENQKLFYASKQIGFSH